MASDLKNININDIKFFVSTSYEENLPLFFSTQKIPDGVYKKNENVFFVNDNIPYAVHNVGYEKIKELECLENKNYIFSIKKHFIYKLIQKIKEKNINPNDVNFKSEVKNIFVEFFTHKLKDRTKNPERVINFLMNTTYKKLFNNFLNKIIIIHYGLKTRGLVLAESNNVTVLNDKGAMILTNGMLRVCCCLLLNIDNIPVIIDYPE